ncbi:hypothetical protein [Hymenobacter sp. DG25B]|uniref:hypothetical protein n=1 Tax=Hymenobacter sp. DG25B TaxID=1385664 RepID=UPI000B16DDB2|nr:hypothetical protein [Hymenobacter sp. DG25B]
MPVVTEERNICVNYFHILLLYTALIVCVSCNEKAANPQPNAPKITEKVSGFRAVFSEPTAVPGAAGLVGTKQFAFSSYGTDQPFWIGLNENASGYTALLTRVDTTGKVLTTKSLFNFTTDLAATPDGGCWIAGYGILSHLDANGVVDNSHVLTNDNNGQGVLYNSIHSTIDNGCIITCTEFDEKSEKRFLVSGKVDSQGKIEYLNSYEYPGNPISSAQLKNGNVLVLGGTLSNTNKTIILTELNQQNIVKNIEITINEPYVNFSRINFKIFAMQDNSIAISDSDNSLFIHLDRELNLLKSLSIAGLFTRTGGVYVSENGTVGMVGESPNYVNNTILPQGLYYTEFNINSQPENASCIEMNPDGKWTADYGRLLNTQGLYRYFLGNLMAPINGGVPISFRVIKVKSSNPKSCASNDSKIPLTINSINLTTKATNSVLKTILPISNKPYSFKTGSSNIQATKKCD